MCAGQGHDVIGVLQDHPRVKDVRATLIELDDHNVQGARQRAAATHLTNVEVLQADASTTDVYRGLVPADIVLVVSLFENISNEDIRRTIAHLPTLCADGASVLWTRGGPLAEEIRSWFVAANFREELDVECHARHARHRPPAAALPGVG